MLEYQRRVIHHPRQVSRIRKPLPPPPPPPEDRLCVVVAAVESQCSDCGERMAPGDYVRMDSRLGTLCLTCADLDGLEFLPSGDVALTRRAAKYSAMCAIVFEWLRSRKKYARRGILVEPEAIARALDECAADAGEREKLKARRAVRAVAADVAHAAAFSARIRALFPGCPAEEAELIADHACRRHSGRVGRSAAAKELADDSVILAVRASVRHRHTPYDQLLAAGVDRDEARARIAPALERVVDRWRLRPAGPGGG